MSRSADFADVPTKEEIFGVKSIHLRKPKKKKKKKKRTAKVPFIDDPYRNLKLGLDVQARGLGKRIKSPVRRYLRSEAGKLKKKSIKGYTRKVRNWGPAQPIAKRLIYQIQLKYKLKNDRKAVQLYEKKGKHVFKSLEEMIKYYKTIPEFVIGGVIGGIQIYRKLWLKKVPQFSGALREELLKSIESNLPSSKKNFRFPYDMRVGVNLPYASIVNNYKSPVKVQHRAGDTPGNKGDQNAEYQFFEKFPKRFMDVTNLGFRNQSSLLNMEYDKFIFFLNTAPLFL